MAVTMVDILRDIVQDNNPDPTKRIWSDDECIRVLKNYMTIFKLQPLKSLDGMYQRFDSNSQFWMDGLLQYRTADDSQAFNFTSNIYTGPTQILAAPTTYVVDVNDGAVIFLTPFAVPTNVFATFQFTNPYHAGADLIEELAGKKSRTSLGVQLGSLSVNLSKLPADLRKQADELRGRGGPIIGNHVRSDKLPRRNHNSDFNWMNNR
jgi:hypothetical protein